MGTAKFTSVEDYLASQDATKAATLKAVIAFTLEAFPELALKMAWNVPQIHRGGDYVMGLAAYKKHLTLAPWSVFVMEVFQERLRPYVVFKNCFQIPVDWEIDRNLLTDLVRARLAELD
ncbi:iron chaperone [Duganella sp. PWIR1]